MEPLPVFLGYGFDSARCGSIPEEFPSLDAMRYWYDTARNGSRYDTDTSMHKCTGTATGVHVCCGYRNWFSFMAYLFVRVREGEESDNWCRISLGSFSHGILCLEHGILLSWSPTTVPDNS